jgi:hypothetical protein
MALSKDKDKSKVLSFGEDLGEVFFHRSVLLHESIEGLHMPRLAEADIQKKF